MYKGSSRCFTLDPFARQRSYKFITPYNIMTDELNMKKLSAIWVPPMLSDAPKRAFSLSCQHDIDKAQKTFLKDLLLCMIRHYIIKTKMKVKSGHITVHPIEYI